MFPAIQIGPLALPTSPIVLLLAFMAALEVVQRSATRLGLPGDDVYNLGYLAAVVGLLGARLGYVLQYWAVFSSDLRSIFALTPDSLSPGVGIGFGLIAGFAYAQRKGLDNLRLLDALAPGLVVVAAGMALADLASGNSYGSPTTLPWAVEMWNAHRHPVQVYHLLAALAIGLILVKTLRPFDGAHFGLVVALYAASRLLLEAFHGDSTALVGELRSVQVVSLVVLIGTLIVMRQWATAHSYGGTETWRRGDAETRSATTGFVALQMCPELSQWIFVF